MKHHPFFADVLKGGECIAYGARALNEGGYQSVPKLTFPGGALIGCSAGFLNVPKIKGTHTAMKSGMLAAETAFESITANPEAEAGSQTPLDTSAYQSAVDNSWIMKELKEVRNLRPSFHNPLGMWGGIAYSGLDSLILKGRVPWTFHHPGEDYTMTKKASEFKPIEYPSPDGELSFDILTSVARTGTNHTENQPVHLVVKDGDYARHTKENAIPYAGLLNKACPAAVYEYVDVKESGGEEHADGKRFVINSQNCIHCK
jgi:electron-transferring-flavoprotein dehydrogenase